jgi:hypothetical protein
MTDSNGWERWLHIAGSIASLTALGYLLLHLPRKGKRVAVAGLRGLPAHGRIPAATAKRALKRLPKKTRACVGMTVAALREGMEIEREHRDITQGRVGQTAKIAAAHICERPDYYKRIKRYVEG